MGVLGEGRGNVDRVESKQPGVVKPAPVVFPAENEHRSVPECVVAIDFGRDNRGSRMVPAETETATVVSKNLKNAAFSIHLFT